MPFDVVSGECLHFYHHQCSKLTSRAGQPPENVVANAVLLHSGQIHVTYSSDGCDFQNLVR